MSKISVPCLFKGEADLHLFACKLTSKSLFSGEADLALVVMIMKQLLLKNSCFLLHFVVLQWDGPNNRCTLVAMTTRSTFYVTFQEGTSCDINKEQIYGTIMYTFIVTAPSRRSRKSSIFLKSALMNHYDSRSWAK